LIPKEWTKVPGIIGNGFFFDSHIITEADSKHPDSSEDSTGNGLDRVGRIFLPIVYNTNAGGLVENGLIFG
jgi:hypothetical protein